MVGVEVVCEGVVYYLALCAGFQGCCYFEFLGGFCGGPGAYLLMFFLVFHVFTWGFWSWVLVLVGAGFRWRRWVISWSWVLNSSYGIRILWSGFMLLRWRPVVLLQIFSEITWPVSGV